MRLHVTSLQTQVWGTELLLAGLLPGCALETGELQWILFGISSSNTYWQPRPGKVYALVMVRSHSFKIPVLCDLPVSLWVGWTDSGFRNLSVGLECFVKEKSLKISVTQKHRGKMDACLGDFLCRNPAEQNKLVWLHLLAVCQRSVNLLWIFL